LLAEMKSANLSPLVEDVALAGFHKVANVKDIDYHLTCSQ